MNEEELSGMEEETTLPESEAEDAFASGWNEEQEFQAEEPESEEVTPETDADPGQEEQEEGTPPEGGTEETPAEQEEKTQEEEQSPKTWELDGPGGQKVSVSEEQMMDLARQGMDYGRVRGLVDQAAPFMDLMIGFAREANMSLDEYRDWLTAQSMQSKGMSEAEANAEVQRQNSQRMTYAEQQRMEAAAAQERQQQDLRMFIETFPDAAREPDKIPKEVWDKVDRGMPLVAAYSQYAVNQANAAKEAVEQKAAAEAQNRTNSSRATGSMRSAGEESGKKDPFLSGWEE